MNDTARALFEAHVKQELASFEQEALRGSIAREVARVFEWLGGITLNQLATREHPEFLRLRRQLFDFIKATEH